MPVINIRHIFNKSFQNFHSFKRFFNHKLGEPQELIQSKCRDFVKNELGPIAAHLDENSIFPHKQIQQLGNMGFLGMCKNFADQNSTLNLAIAVEELSRGCASTALIVSIHNALYLNIINKHGTIEQKKKYLNEFTDGKIGCFALSEPNAGSNVGEIQTTAKISDNFWVINGTKSWVTSAYEGDAMIVFAKTNTDLKNKGITAFIVDKNTSGITLGPKDRLLGLKALSCCNVTFKDVYVSKDNVLGNINEGFKIAMNQLDQARIGVAGLSIGIAQAALDCALCFSHERKILKLPIAHLPAIKSRIAEMVISLEGARLLTWKAAIEYDSDVRTSQYSSTAKVAASRCANFVTDNCIQIMGGMGVVKNYSAERHYRDARMTKIIGGVTDVQKDIIAHEILKKFEIFMDS